MTNQNTRFAIGTDRLEIIARTGKTGIAVFARTRAEGQRAVIGCRSVFLEKNETDAQARYDQLVQESTAAGWLQRAGSGVTASKFTAIPKPGQLPASVALAAKTAVKATPKKGAKK